MINQAPLKGKEKASRGHFFPVDGKNFANFSEFDPGG
jgi:hypothetical protein